MSSSRVQQMTAQAHAALAIPADMKDAYWDVVVECLTQFHHFSEMEARRQSNDLRAKIENPPEEPELKPFYHADLTDLFYNTEPFDVACNLADQELDYLQYRDAYFAILSRHNW